MNLDFINYYKYQAILIQMWIKNLGEKLSKNVLFCKAVWNFNWFYGIKQLQK